MKRPQIDSADEMICLGQEDLAEQGGHWLRRAYRRRSSHTSRSRISWPPSRTSTSTTSTPGGKNPTVEAVEHKLARLERGEACKAFDSGMAAVSAVLLGLLEASDHVQFVNQTYGPTLQLARHLRRFGFGLEHDLLLDLDLGTVRATIRENTHHM